jgi:hypothetical protein
MRSAYSHPSHHLGQRIQPLLNLGHPLDFGAVRIGGGFDDAFDTARAIPTAVVPIVRSDEDERLIAASAPTGRLARMAFKEF